ncbi:MAG: hypothetical protein NVSMB7_00950 [Chitinophagaceae bacterium]
MGKIKSNQFPAGIFNGKNTVTKFRLVRLCTILIEDRTFLSAYLIAVAYLVLFISAGNSNKKFTVNTRNIYPSSKRAICTLKTYKKFHTKERYVYNNLNPKRIYFLFCKETIMEKRVLGVILSLLGVVGLIYAGISFMNGGSGTRNVKAIIFSGVVGAIFFFAGISLVRNTKDKAT